MRDITVTIIQDVLHWHNPANNRAMYDQYLETAGQTDLVVLPEMFSSGFSMQPKDCHENMEGETVAWMLRKARQKKSIICGSLIMRLDEATFVNRMIWARPCGEIDYYDKRHLFRYGKEHINFSAGDQRVIVELYGWRILLLVCYDLRFPVWSRNRNDYDIAIYVANWPSARQFAWDSLLVARAIENLSYVVGVNRIGKDAIGNSFAGGSVILDYMGQSLKNCQNKKMMVSQTLSMQKLEAFRDYFPARLDADEFKIHC